MLIEILLKGTPVNLSYPLCCVKLNDVFIFNDRVKENTLITHDFSPSMINTLKVVHYGKAASDTIVKNGSIVADKAIQLSYIKLDNHNIPPEVLHDNPFFVDWFPHDKKANENLPKYLKDTLYFGHNGAYMFKFYGDTTKEIMNQQWTKESHAHRTQTTNDDTFERYGENVKIDEDFNLSIFDLEEMIKNDTTAE